MVAFPILLGRPAGGFEVDAAWAIAVGRKCWTLAGAACDLTADAPALPSKNLGLILRDDAVRRPATYAPAQQPLDLTVPLAPWHEQQFPLALDWYVAKPGLPIALGSAESNLRPGNGHRVVEARPDFSTNRSCPRAHWVLNLRGRNRTRGKNN